MPVITAATEQDAVHLHQIAKWLQLQSRESEAAKKSGFFLYVGSEEDYRKTIRQSPFCFLARKDEQCVGFVTTMTPQALAQMPAGPNRDLFERNGEFPLLIEQIGVLPEWQNRGIGQALLDALIAQSGAPWLMATVVHAPVRNERSIRFLLRNGWTLYREVATRTRVWGFYEFRRTLK
ncbi:MAG: GNAT family N-acetyltransferase [Bryobacterales bacterium]|nr:GNAT family N-acetyltransferase [Bryobacterales bacterium]